MKACLDIDGCVLDFSTGLKSVLEKKGYSFDPREVKTYSFKDVSIPRSEIYSCFKDISLYRNAPLFDGAKEAVKRLKKFVKIEAYTGAENEESIITERKNLLKKLNITGNVYVGKKPVVQDADFLFDDCLGVHECWAQENPNATLFLIDAPYNQKTEENENSLAWKRVIRCRNLSDAVDKCIAMID